MSKIKDIFVLKILIYYIRMELPGWGRIYAFFVGGRDQNEYWGKYGARLIQDKRYGLYRLLLLREWADRIFYFLGSWYEKKTQILADSLIQKDMSIVDIGANYGHFTLVSASKVGTAGHVFAFEPNPNAFRRLQVHVELNELANVKTHNIGISDQPGELVLSVPTVNSGEATFAGTPFKDATSFVSAVETLDSQPFETRIDLIKIDVEGFELRVLRGASAIIRRDRPIVVTEVIARHLARDETDPGELASYFSEINYAPYKLELKRNGFIHCLELKAGADDLEDGDYVWLPKESAELNVRKLSGAR